jgi:plasmid maintenance system antidote protein VapI
VTSFSFDISEKDLAGAQFISKASRRLIAAFVQKMRTEKLTKQQIADLLDVDKSTVSRMLRGNSNLTLRTIGELAWAMDVDPDLALQPFDKRMVNQPMSVAISVVHSGTVRPANRNAGTVILSNAGIHP